MGEIVNHLTVAAGDHLELGHFYSSIEQVEGGLLVQRGAIFDAPQLTRASLFIINEGAQVRVPQLASVGELFVIGAEVAFPNLTRVRGRLDAECGAVVDAPALTRVPRLIVSDATVRIPALDAPGEFLRVWEGAVVVGPRGVRAQPGDTWSRLWRRVRLAPATVPHGGCARSPRCVEHARDRRVLDCKRRGRFTKE